jgi:type II secretory pathway component GspD/PulD (secretin)
MIDLCIIPLTFAVAVAAMSPQDLGVRQQVDAAEIRKEFGNHVRIGPDGRITKRYSLGAESGSAFDQLLVPFRAAEPILSGPGARFGGPEPKTVLGQLLGNEHTVELVYVRDFKRAKGMAFRADARQQARPSHEIRNSLLLVTAAPDALRSFEHALDLVFADPTQIEIAVNIVEYAIGDTSAAGTEPIDADTPTLKNQSPEPTVEAVTLHFPITAPFLGAEGRRDGGRISLGGIHDSWKLNAALQRLETRHLVDSTMAPKMLVRDGGVATFATRKALPFPRSNATERAAGPVPIDFKDVGTTMEIRPEIVGTDTIVLNIYISRSLVVGFAATEPIPTPIIETHVATTTVLVKDGHTTVIGGCQSKDLQEAVSKMPVPDDLPSIGDVPLPDHLLGSTATQRSETTVEFHITPRIVRVGGMPVRGAKAGAKAR